MTELLAGRIDILFEAPTLSLPYIKSGKLRALAVTSPGRWKAMPEVAPVAETLPGYEVASFIGVATTAGTPKAVIARLNREIRNIIEQSDTARRLAELGGDPQASSPEEMQRLVEATSRKWRNVIDVRKIERQ